MRKLVAGLVVGFVLGVLGTLGVQHVRRQRESAQAGRTVDVFEVVPIVMERALPGVRVLDVALQSPSTHSVSYQYEALYDAQITYQLNGRIKRVTLPFGHTRDGLIFPKTTDVVIADDKAEVVQALGAGGPASVQPNKEMQRTRPAQSEARR